MSTENGNTKPTHIVKIRDGYGKKATYHRIGAAWEDLEKGSLYVKLYGTQIVSEGFQCYPVEKQS